MPSKLKGVKVIRNRRGEAKQLVIDVDKHYDMVEDLLDLIDAEKRLKEPTVSAATLYARIEKKSAKKINV